MTFFTQISPEAEELLKEIINLKENKTDTSEYWHKRFTAMEFDDEIIYRSMFKELKDAEFISVDWADDIPWLLVLTNKGKNYFKHKQIHISNNGRNDNNMTFIKLDNMSEQYLKRIIEEYNNNNDVFFDETACKKICNEKAIWDELISSQCLTGKTKEYITGALGLDGIALTQKGKTYFERKENHQELLEMTRPISNHFTINASGDNSPINAVQGSGTATQTVDYANNEQFEALSQLSKMINSAKEFTDDEREEILELIDSATNAAKENKKSVLKTLFAGINAALSKAPTFIIEKWDSIKLMFSE